ncbi:AraC family transcriptional regulator N-terminal domain-containing protein [Gryllotalpicola reticulitermitis]|uniref:AraC family transcriptional regulator N-terminal domain-containing protein n=1 Tax=Gryllotalpicola reticulitermitis TaxID=1184153 RepID=A0ABV8PZU8_9MICO
MNTVDELLDEITCRVERQTRAVPVRELGDLIATRHNTSEPDYELAEPLFVLMVQGGKRLYVGDAVVEYRAGDCLCVTTSMPLSGHFLGATPERPALAVGLRLTAPKVAELLHHLPDASRLPRVSAAVATFRADTDLLDAIARLLRIADDPVDAAALGPLIEREILWRLVRGPHGVNVAQIGLDGSVLHHIGEAISAVRSSFTEPLSIPELSRISAMSPSTFHRHFRRVTGMSPLQYQKSLQLQEARSLLLSERSATEAAILVGYRSPTQFNREYRRYFGLPPARDVARLRGAQ